MARRVLHNEHLSPEEKWELELQVRARRANEKRNDPKKFIPHKDPEKGPTVGESLAYYAERNRALSEMSSGVHRADTESEDDFLFPRAAGAPWEGLSQEQLAAAHLQAAEKAAGRLGASGAWEGAEGASASRYGELVSGAGASADDHGGALAAGLDPPNKYKLCSMCGWAGTRYRCSRCQRASYCSKSCQRGHWAAHAADCNAEKERRAAAPNGGGGEGAVKRQPAIATDLD